MVRRDTILLSFFGHAKGSGTTKEIVDTLQESGNQVPLW